MVFNASNLPPILIEVKKKFYRPTYPTFSEPLAETSIFSSRPNIIETLLKSYYKSFLRLSMHKLSVV